MDKRSVSTRSVQFSGNHKKYYIGWTLVTSCGLTGAYQTFRGAWCVLLHSRSEQSGDTVTLHMQGARKSQWDLHKHKRKDNGKQDMWKPCNKNGLVAAVDLTGHLATCLHNLSASSPSSPLPSSTLGPSLRPHSDTTENYNLKTVL